MTGVGKVYNNVLKAGFWTGRDLWWLVISGEDSAPHRPPLCGPAEI